MKKEKVKKKQSATRSIALGFALIIFVGAIMLTLPIATRTGEVNFIASLFTATSATCVTGLVVADTYQNWSVFGQIVVITMIQLGGLGFMTVGVYISVLLKKKIGLQERESIHESVNTLETAGVVRLVKKIVQGTFIIEGIGAMLLATRFIPRFGVKRGIYYSVFHSISAFCNAGFDLMGIEGEYSSLVAFEDDIVVNLVVMSLILIGGLGFIVWDDIQRNKWHFKKYLLHSKIVIISTVIITLVTTILFFTFEYNNTLRDMTLQGKILGAAFSSVTPRTAGFNTVDTAALSEAGKLLSMVLMFIGGSPGSTAGGAKTTTIVVLVCYAIAMIRSHEDINLFGRRLTADVVKKANAVVMINLVLSLIVAMMIMAMQPMLAGTDVMFEVLSAINTVGMTTGITRELNVVARMLIIILMYCGRLGSLSFALVFAQKNTMDSIRQPQEKIIVG
ncbi:MAG: Trk family potassium uptake protein [Lachnospiraceae bacterium]|nr:Trk family potassium uptake protein [Lachnospiraceae bacterium]MEE1258422.1 TrkH family potassium uptake protein [Lachnospiraceae bacterium]